MMDILYKPKCFLVLFFAIGISACASMPTLDKDSNFSNIDKLILKAEKAQFNKSIKSTRKYCDDALFELMQNKNSMSLEEYEQKHSQIALLRIRSNQTPENDTSYIRCELFPLVWNDRVERWIKYYTGSGRNDLIRCMKRSRKYINYVRKTLKEEGLPQDLAYVPIVESGYYPFARSRVGAMGLWQFMASTGKKSGLKINEWVDERRDPVKATQAAVKYLDDLHSEFGSWELALAAYNYGSNGVKRRIRKWKTDDYWQLYLPRETENFVPKIMAVMFLVKEPEVFGFDPAVFEQKEDIPMSKFKVYDSVDLRKIASWSGMTIKDVQAYNPELKLICTPPKQDYEINIPTEFMKKLETKFNVLENSERYLAKNDIEMLMHKVVYYRVKYGDSLWKIAKKHNVTTKQLKAWNRLASNRIYPKQRLKVRQGGQPVTSSYIKSNKSEYYQVKYGDSLWKIAKKFEVSTNKIKKWNNLSNDNIYPRQKLIVKKLDGNIRYYKVKYGDNLWKIAKKFKVSTNKIKKWNNLSNDQIFPSQTLKIY